MNYWLFSIMYENLPDTWPKMVKRGIAAQHYPPNWGNESKNIRHLKKLKRGDRIVAAFHGHRFGGYGTLTSGFYRGGPSMKIQGRHGVYEFQERFGCKWTTLPVNSVDPFINLHDLKKKGFDIDLTIGLCVKQIDKKTYELLRDELDSAGAKPVVTRRARPRQPKRKDMTPLASSGNLPMPPSEPSHDSALPEDLTSSVQVIEDPNKLFHRFASLAGGLETGSPVMPPTLIYNEGWMLRLTLDRFASLGITETHHLMEVPPGCRWYSEALLPTIFRPEARSDERGESCSHADGVVGHFDIGNNAKGKLVLRPDARHLVVIEAKMFSLLSAGVRNAPSFNQAARIVACMAEIMRQAGRPAKEFDRLGFCLVAPESQIRLGIIDRDMNASSLYSIVERRASDFKDSPDIANWFADWCVPLLERLEIRVTSWEEVLRLLVGRDPEAGVLEGFYERCLKYNTKGPQ